MATDTKTSNLAASAVGAGVKSLAKLASQRVLSSVGERIEASAERLTDYTSNGGGPGLMAAFTGRGDGQGAKNKGLKVTNIVEQIDVGVPARLAYDQWTRFTDFPTFMKKVESVEQESEEKLSWKAQILWSHRTWESTIVEQVPDRRIVWRSEGQKGSADGAVSFHEIGPDLTRIILVLEYHPQGFFERTGNLWRAQGRRARLELKHFARHVMSEGILHPEEIEGWRGEIHDGEVVTDQETARSDDENAEQKDNGGRDRDRSGDRGRRAQGERTPRRGTGGGDDRPTRGPARRGGSQRRPAKQGSQ